MKLSFENGMASPILTIAYSIVSMSIYLMLHSYIWQVLSSNLSNSSSFQPFLPHLSPLLPKPKSEILTKPNCSKSPLFTNNNASPLPSSSQAKASNASSTKCSERVGSTATTVDAATSTRLRPSSLKMKARAKQLRLLSGRALATECGVGSQSHLLHKQQSLPSLSVTFCQYVTAIYLERQRGNGRISLFWKMFSPHVCPQVYLSNEHDWPWQTV